MTHPTESSAYIEPEEVHLNDYLNVLYRRRKAALAAFAVVFLGVALYTLLVQPVYEASATLHVRDEKVQGNGFLNELGLTRDNPIETELELLKSRTNIEEVVRRLHLNWVIDDAPDDLDARILEFSSAAEEPVYTINLLGGGAFEVEKCNDKDSCRGRAGELLREGELSLLIDRLQGEKGDSFTLSLQPFNRTVAGLRSGIGASEVGRGTNIIRASYRHTDPELAGRIVNTLAEVYLERSITLKTEEARKSVSFIESQLEEVGAVLESAEKSLEDFKSESGIVQLDSEVASLVDRLTEVEKQRSAVTLQLRQVEFAVDAIGDAMDNGRIYSPSVLADDAVVAALSEELAKLEIERRAVLAQATERHPQALSLQEQIDELQKKLLATYEIRRKTLAVQMRGLDAELEQFEGVLKQFPEAEQKLARLTRLATVNADIYTFLLQKHEEARIARAAAISNINVIDPAIPPDEPIKPKKKKNLLLGMIVGLILGAGLAFFQEYLDDTIKDADSAKRHFGSPVLATIPFIERRDETDREKRILISRLEPKSAPAEAFRALRTAIHFAGGQKKKTLLITSTIAGEGKTTASANLAQTMAQTGTRVLLIGCDLRRPTLHTVFSAPPRPGLTELLIGDAEPDEVVHGSDTGGLDFISAGTTPPNPAELLSSTRMREVLDSLAERYDTIMLDAPPLLAVTDAAVLTPYADLAMVVVEAGKVSAKAAGRMSEELRRTKVPVAGLIFNDKTGKGQHYYGGYYGGYGYGYSDDPAAKKGIFKRFFKS